MTKRQVTKEAYRRIVKENEAHQTVYDDLKTKTDIGWEQVAKIVGNMPSQSKRERNKNLIYTYVVLMGLVIILRALSAIVQLGMGNLNAPVLLLILALGLIVPGIAIYGALANKVPIYYSTAALLAFSIFRSVTRESGFMDNPINLLVLIPFVAVIVLSLILPSRLKAKHDLKMVDIEVDGVMKKTKKVVFEVEDEFSTADILDR